MQPKKNRKKPVPNLKFAVAFGFFRFFLVFFGFFSVFCGTFSVFFGLNFDKEFQSFKNHVNNEVLGGQELPNNILTLSDIIITDKIVTDTSFHGHNYSRSKVSGKFFIFPTVNTNFRL